MGIFRRSDKPNVKKMTKQKDVKGLAEALKHEDEKVRDEAHQALLKMLTLEKYGATKATYEAARMLRKSGRPTFESLKIERASTDWDHWLGAIEGLTELGKHGDARPIELLKEHKSHHYNDKNSLQMPASPHIIHALKEIEKSLIELLRTGNREEQEKAALGLEEIVKYGIFFITSDKYEIASLEELRDKAIDALTEALSSNIPSVKEAAINSLQIIRDGWTKPDVWNKYKKPKINL